MEGYRLSACCIHTAEQFGGTKIWIESVWIGTGVFHDAASTGFSGKVLLISSTGAMIRDWNVRLLVLPSSTYKLAGIRKGFPGMILKHISCFQRSSSLLDGRWEKRSTRHCKIRFETQTCIKCTRPPITRVWLANIEVGPGWQDRGGSGTNRLSQSSRARNMWLGWLAASF